MNDRQRQRSISAAWWFSALAVLLLGGGLVAAWWVGELDPSRAALLGISGSIALVAAVFTIESLARGEGLQFDSHWGGLGGGMGGWRLSSSLVLVVVAMIFLAATFAAAGVDFSVDAEAQNDTASDNDTEASGDGAGAANVQVPGSSNAATPQIPATDREGSLPADERGANTL